jgi:hypothetical protein
MKVMRIVAVLSASIPLTIAGCKTQPQKAAPDSAHAVAQAAGPSPASTTPTNAQRPSPVFVYSAPLSAPQATPAANGGQEEVREGGSRLDLPQAGEYVELQGAARTTLETTLSGATGSSPVLLPDEATATLMGGLPKEFRDSCDAMLEGWGENLKGAGKWTARVLYSLHLPGGTEAVLAFRCASAFPGVETYYDERPATVSLTPEAATLNLIPLDKKCDNCSDLYHLELSQAFTAVGSRLAELRVYYSNDNLCCGGEDEKSVNRMMILDLSRGKEVLGVDERTEQSSHDDSDDGGDSETVCETKISYLRDEAGNVESIATETRCTENKKPLPEVKRQRFRWNAEAHRYDEVK